MAVGLTVMCSVIWWAVRVLRHQLSSITASAFRRQ
jgi:hypothetical protein